MKNYNGSKGDEIILQGGDNCVFQITNSGNGLDLLKGKGNSTNKLSVIDLGQCENLLKKHYHINENISLIIIKFEKVSDKSSERSLQYEVYEPFNKTKLNLSICDNITIDIYIPVILSEKTQNLFNELKDLGYDLFDINSPFYQDICTPYKSSDGTDVPLTDRINSYYNNEETSCQSNCKFSEYLMESQYLKCDCDIINTEINTQETNKFSAKSIYQSFFNVLKYSNYKVLKCSKLAFTINSITKNIGSIVSIVYFFIYLIFVIIYFLKGISQIKTDLTKKIQEKIEKKAINKPKNFIDSVKEKNLRENNQKDNYIKNFKNSKYNKYNRKDNLVLKKAYRKKHSQRIIFTNPPKKNFPKSKSDLDSKSKINEQINNHNNILVTNKASSINFYNKNEKIKENVDINPQIMDIFKLNQKEKEKLDDYELNNLEYDLALKLDKRNFLQIYWSLLKREHLVIFTFITREDHNIMFIKYSRFIFLLCTDMAMNVFFFSDETMHKMFIDYVKYNFIQQIPQITYSTIISKLIEIFLCYLSLTDKHFYQIKGAEKISKSSMKGIMKCIQIKFAFFFVFTSTMFIFYWYLITCFCSVYRNTQIAFIKDSLLSFLLGSLIPFGLYLIPSFLRTLVLKFNKCKIECLYNITNVIPFFKYNRVYFYNYPGITK